MWRKKNNPLQIGITGGIGSGKSLVCRIFSILGILIYDADSRAKLLYIQDDDLKSQIIQNFGKESYTSAGQLNRGYLAKQVFNDSQKVSLLNSLVHPKVGKDYQAWVQKNDQSPYLIKEAALLFESGSYLSLDKIITVFAPVDLRIERVVARDQHRSEVEIRAIIAKQITEEEKINKADYIIYNDNKQLLLPQILRLHQEFLLNISSNEN
ncbi:dephospho-CoA kinase [Rhodocytophaga aerolata]|uniref:Dephospho-CoA kinase n=1 Tax=Rhodocytophaga aerolata TaxID=455078 RepID=A0ABT8R571_9BACT|nr:dephospho-CoA kinase [Rhodocytophaga aerolata]MDO1446831.1 dephospho-CoA kinase [Rhodocytophaga aerolata]